MLYTSLAYEIACLPSQKHVITIKGGIIVYAISLMNEIVDEGEERRRREIGEKGEESE